MWDLTLFSTFRAGAKNINYFYLLLRWMELQNSSNLISTTVPSWVVLFLQVSFTPKSITLPFFFQLNKHPDFVLLDQYSSETTTIPQDTLLGKLSPVNKDSSHASYNLEKNCE